jgi:hypothetical protein
MREYHILVRSLVSARIQAIKAPSPLYMTQPFPPSRSHTQTQDYKTFFRSYRVGVLEYVSAIRDYIRTHRNHFAGKELSRRTWKAHLLCFAASYRRRIIERNAKGRIRLEKEKKEGRPKTSEILLLALISFPSATKTCTAVSS